MTDTLSTAQRSYTMRQVKSADTTPELTVRKALHKKGFRFRLHRRELPGTPDISFPKRRIAVFVHGCFWHRHAGCPRATTPSSNCGYWNRKFERNVHRDQQNREHLKALGWKSIVVWECEIRRGEIPPTVIEALSPE